MTTVSRHDGHVVRRSAGTSGGNVEPATGHPGEPGGVADLLAPGLAVLVCGINPGTRSGELGLHFARPGNRFWKVLHGAGFTPEVLAPADQHQLLALGIGITNLVARTSRAATDLTTGELRAGAVALEATVARWRPAHVAVLGIGAYRTAFRRPAAVAGRQPEQLAGSALWVLPNPSGLQARYQLDEMVALYRPLREAAVGPPPPALARWRP